MDKINTYLENVFYGLPKNEEVAQLKERIRESMEEQYHDLLQSGKNEDEAFGIAVSQFGSIEEIRRELNLPEETAAQQAAAAPPDPALAEEYERFRKKKAAGITAGVALILLGTIVTYILDSIYGDDVVFVPVVMLCFVMCSVSLFVYFGMMGNRYRKFEEGSGCREEEGKDSPLVHTINSVIMTSATVIFLLIGTLFDLWHPTWIIFIVAAMLCKIIRTAFDMKNTSSK